MSSYQLSADNQIEGTLLAAEVLAATGRDVLCRFYPPRTVEIDGGEGFEEAIAEIVANHTPSPARRTKLSPREFVARFPDSVVATIEASNNPHVRKLYREMLLSIQPDLEDPFLIGGIQALVQFGILTPELAAEILDPTVTVNP